MEALGRLSGRQREARVLRYWGNLPESEIADANGHQRGAVKSHVSRGMATWQKRERRRRLVAAVLAVLVIAGADGAALWALSQGDSEAHLVEQPAP